MNTIDAITPARPRNTFSHSMPRTPHIEDCSVIEDSATQRLAVTFHDENLPKGEITVMTGDFLGKGGFGSVFEALTASGERYALKVSHPGMTEDKWRRLTEEVSIMTHFSHHPHIVRLVAAAKDQERAFLLMERCHNMSLADVIRTRPLTKAEILWIGHSLVQTVAYIHAKHCIHRDIKPQNLLFDYAGRLKVTDFGLSARNRTQEPRKSVVGTAAFMLPELAGAVHRKISNRARSQSQAPINPNVLQYGPEADLWSIGVVLYCMMTGRAPYDDYIRAHEVPGMSKQERQLLLYAAVAGTHWQWPSSYFADPDLMALVEAVLCRQAADRATMAYVLQLPLWEQRPATCPASLMKLLSLIEDTRTPSKSAVVAVSGASPIHARTAGSSAAPRSSVSQAADRRLTMEEHTQLHLDLLCEAEADARSGIAAQHMDVLMQFLLLDAELTARRDVLEDELTLMKRLLRDFNARHPPKRPATAAKGASRSIQQQPSFSQRLTYANTTLTSTGTRAGSEDMVSSSPIGAAADLGPARSRSARSTSAAAGTPAARMVRAPSADLHSPNLYMEYPDRATSTKWNLRSRIKVPQDVVDLITVQQRCLNRHVMEELHAIPTAFEGISCNVCAKYYERSASKAVCIYRCSRCNYDVCLRCINEKRTAKNIVECDTCGKKFVTKARLNQHRPTCRGPSVSSSSSRASSATPTRRSALSDTSSTRHSLLDNLPPVMESASAKRRGKRPDLSTDDDSSLRLSTDTVLGADMRLTVPPDHREWQSVSLPQLGGANRPSSTAADGRKSASKRPRRELEDIDAALLPAVPTMLPAREMPALEVLSDDFSGRRSFAEVSTVVDDRRSKSRRQEPVPPPAAPSPRGSTRGKAAAGGPSPRGSASPANKASAPLPPDPVPAVPSATPLRTGRGSKKLTPSPVRENAAPAAAVAESAPTASTASPGMRTVVTIQSEAAARPSDRPEQAPANPKVTQQAYSALTTAASHDDEQRIARARQASSVPPPISTSHLTSLPPRGIAGTHQPATTCRSAALLSQLIQREPSVTSFPSNNAVFNPSGMHLQRGASAAPDDSGRPTTLHAHVDMAPRTGGPHHPTPTSSLQRPGHQGMFPSGAGAQIRPHGHSSVSPSGHSSLRPPVAGPFAAYSAGVVPHRPGTFHPRSGHAFDGASTGGGASPLGGNSAGGRAFLNLPQDPRQRQAFTESFLVGPWMRFFSFHRQTPSVLMLYCMQPGRFGCVFARQSIGGGSGIGTMVIDVHSRMVLLVVGIVDGDVPRVHTNAHVTSFFEDELYLIALAEARQEYPQLTEPILAFAQEASEAMATGAALQHLVLAAHIYNAADAHVPPQTPFTYVRRLWPAPDGTLHFFRLSNHRSQIVTTADMDIRWQSDRHSNVGMRYYVFPDGRTEPYQNDRFGFLEKTSRIVAANSPRH